MPTFMTLQTLALDLGVDVDDVCTVAAWLTGTVQVDDQLDVEMQNELAGVLDAGGDRMSMCTGCGRRYVAGRVLVGWEPCGCGGHRTRWCRDDVGGCGETRFSPPLNDDTCRPAEFGFRR